jgi:hypothetical protein
VVSKRLLGQQVTKAASEGNVLYPIPDEINKEPLHVSDEEAIAILRRLQDDNPGKELSRAFFRRETGITDSSWVNRFGTFQQFKRDAGLQTNRGAHHTELHIASHSYRDTLRGFQEIELNPYIGKYERPKGLPGYKKLVVASDFHGLQLDRFCFEVFLDTIKRLKPDNIILNGDIYDLYNYSRFDQDPRQGNLIEELKYVRDFIFAEIRRTSGDLTQIDLIIGNHEQRILKHMADRTPWVKAHLDFMGVTLNRMFGIDKYEINLVSRADLSAFKPVEHKEELKRNYKLYYNCFVAQHDAPRGKEFILCGTSGHSHKPDLSYSFDERTGSKWWLTTGCMAKVDFEYVQGFNKYQNGFGIVHIDTQKQACVAESIVVNDSFTVVGGKVYKRP